MKSEKLSKNRYYIIKLYSKRIIFDGEKLLLFYSPNKKFDIQSLKAFDSAKVKIAPFRNVNPVVKLHLSNKCNLRCSYCFASHNKTSDLSNYHYNSIIESVFTFFEKKDKNQIHICYLPSGEPFLDINLLNKVYDILYDKYSTGKFYAKDFSQKDIWKLISLLPSKYTNISYSKNLENGLKILNDTLLDKDLYKELKITDEIINNQSDWLVKQFHSINHLSPKDLRIF